MARCGCKPGTYENGWHEERSDECRRAEREAFVRAIAAVQEQWRVRPVPRSS